MTSEFLLKTFYNCRLNCCKLGVIGSISVACASEILGISYIYLMRYCIAKYCHNA